MNVLERLLGDILSAWPVDLWYIETLCEKHKFEEIDFDEVKEYSWKENIKMDDVITYLLNEIAEKFINANIEEIAKILKVEWKEGLEEYREDNDIFVVYGGWHTSSIEFENEKINTLFDDIVDISREES